MAASECAVSQWAEPPESTRVLVVGAGVNGLATARALQDEEVLQIEKQAQIGGVWHAYGYPELRIHTGGGGYSYPDHPFVDSEGYYTMRSTAPEVMQYLLGYYQTYKERVELYLNTELVGLHQQHPDGLITCSIVHNDNQVEWVFTHVVLACLHIPQMPPVPKSPSIIHCSRASKQLLEQRSKIALVGAGKSACDLIVYLRVHVHQALTQILWTSRRGSALWFISREAMLTNEFGRLRHGWVKEGARIDSNSAALAEFMRVCYYNPTGHADSNNPHRCRGGYMGKCEYDIIREVPCILHDQIGFDTKVLTLDGDAHPFDLCVLCTGSRMFSLRLNGQPIQEILTPNLLRGMTDPAYPRILLQHPIAVQPSVKLAWLHAQWIQQYVSRGVVASDLEHGEVDGWSWYWGGNPQGYDAGTCASRLDGWWDRAVTQFGNEVRADLALWAPDIVNFYDNDLVGRRPQTLAEMEAFDAEIYQVDLSTYESWASVYCQGVINGTDSTD